MRKHQTGSKWSVVLPGVFAILVALLSGCGTLPGTTSDSSDKGQTQPRSTTSASPLAQSPSPKSVAPAAPANSTTRAAAQPAAGSGQICISLTRHDQVAGEDDQEGKVEGEISGVDNATLTLSIDGKPTGQQVASDNGARVTSTLAYGGKHVIELTAFVNGQKVGTSFDKSDWDSGVSTCSTIEGGQITALKGLAFATSTDDMEEYLLLVPDEGMGSLASEGKDYLTNDGTKLSPTDWHAVPASGHFIETKVKAFGPAVPAGQTQTVATILDAQLNAGALVNN